MSPYIDAVQIISSFTYYEQESLAVQQSPYFGNADFLSAPEGNDFSSIQGVYRVCASLWPKFMQILSL